MSATDTLITPTYNTVSDKIIEPLAKIGPNDAISLNETTQTITLNQPTVFGGGLTGAVDLNIADDLTLTSVTATNLDASGDITADDITADNVTVNASLITNGSIDFNVLSAPVNMIGFATDPVPVTLFALILGRWGLYTFATSTATSNSTGFRMSIDTAVLLGKYPAGITAGGYVTYSAPVVDNGSETNGSIWFSTNLATRTRFSKTSLYSETNFTNSGTKGVKMFTVPVYLKQ